MSVNKKFPLHAIFPSVSSIFTHRKSINEIKDTCIVSLDTNVLLAPYDLGQSGLREIKRAYESLAAGKRIIIIDQVIREFVKNKDEKIAALRKSLNDHSSKASEPMKKPTSFLEGIDGYKESAEISAQIGKLIKDYRSNINRVIDEINSWRGEDPLWVAYRKIFAECIYEFNLEREGKDSFVEDMNNRYDLSIPPGYKDAGKENGGSGDLLIWKAILQYGTENSVDFVFVTSDQKSDWWTQSDGAPLYPRHELIDEYKRASNGKTLHIILFSDFLSIFGVTEEIVEEVRKSEAADIVEAKIESATISPIKQSAFGNVSKIKSGLSTDQLFDIIRNSIDNVPVGEDALKDAIIKRIKNLSIQFERTSHRIDEIEEYIDNQGKYDDDMKIDRLKLELNSLKRLNSSRKISLISLSDGLINLE